MPPNTPIRAAELVKTLVRLSERAANVARSLRSKPQLLELLTEQKAYCPKLRRDKPDFKTLADVLIQETIRYYLGQKYPVLSSQVRGEENSQFTNTRGTFINVQVLGTIESTTEMLMAVLDGNEKAARALAESVHREPDPLVDAEAEADKIDAELPVGRFGIWIDPIDSTSEYVYGKSKEEPKHGVYLSGLQCVTVLIGVFDLETGAPLCGVVNQPFHHIDPETKRWVGRVLWGLSYGDQTYCYNIRSSIAANAATAIPNSQSLAAADNNGTTSSTNGSTSSVETTTTTPRRTPIIVLSSSETEQLRDALDESFTTLYAAGAGYKLMCVADGVADAYVLSRPTTFKWDSCGPHAILRAAGGGVCDFAKAVTEFDFESVDNNRQYELGYMHPDNPEAEHPECWSNEGGLIAYASLDAVKDIVQKLKDVVEEGLME